MTELLQRDRHASVPIGGGESRARAELRAQIGRLERDLARTCAEAFPHRVDEARAPATRRPRLLDLGELEATRDRLVARVGAAETALRERREEEGDNRELLELMLADPAGHKWLRIGRADIGEPGCGHWHSVPRYGLLGMLMGWWRVKISSGCPL